MKQVHSFIDMELGAVLWMSRLRVIIRNGSHSAEDFSCKLNVIEHVLLSAHLCINVPKPSALRIGNYEHSTAVAQHENFRCRTVHTA